MGKKNNTSAYQHKKTPLITDMKRHKWQYTKTGSLPKPKI